MDKKDLMQVGDLVLHDNKILAAGKYVRAIGIVISKDFYIDIDSMLKTPISKKEAISYGRRMKMKLPTKSQLGLIQQNIETVNQSLHAIGHGDYMLLGNICSDFWMLRNEAKDEKERRRVLLVAPITK